MVCHKYEHDSSEFDTLDCWILAAIARSYHHQDGWSLLEPSLLGDTQLLPLIIMFRSYNYGMRLVVASSRGSIDIDLDDLSLGALSCSRCFLLRFE